LAAAVLRSAVNAAAAKASINHNQRKIEILKILNNFSETYRRPQPFSRRLKDLKLPKTNYIPNKSLDFLFQKKSI